jgi:hypothetical protein
MVTEHVDPTGTESAQVVAETVAVPVPADGVGAPEKEDATVAPSKSRGKSPSLMRVAVIVWTAYGMTAYPPLTVCHA